MLFVAFRRSARLGGVVLAAAIAALLAGLFVARAARAQGAPTSPIAYHYLRDNGDTLGTETVTTTANAISGVLALKGQPRIEWSHAHANQRLGVLTLKIFAATSPDPLQSGTVDIRGDSAYVDFASATQRTKQAMSTKAGATPLVNASVLHAALLASYARLGKQPSIEVFLTSGGQTFTATVATVGDTTTFRLATSDMRIVQGADGLPAYVLLPGQGARVMRAGVTLNPATSKVNYDAPAGAPYTAEHVRIPSGRGYDLAATLTRPVRSAPVPVVITISGSGPQERDSRISIVPGYAIFRQIADTLGRRGIAVLRFDDRGVGESSGRESAANSTSADFADDVRSIIAWLRARPDIDGSRIALAGHSEGGLIAPMIAASDPKLKGIALLAGPAYDGRRIIQFQYRQGIDSAPGLTAAQRDSIWKSVPATLDSMAKATPWVRYFLSYNPVPTATHVKQPVLVLQGATDRQVTAEQADSLVMAIKAGGNRDVTLRTFPATNHLFLRDPSGLPSGYSRLENPKVNPDMLGALADWMVRVLK